LDDGDSSSPNNIIAVVYKTNSWFQRIEKDWRAISSLLVMNRSLFQNFSQIRGIGVLKTNLAMEKGSLIAAKAACCFRKASLCWAIPSRDRLPRYGKGTASD
jgi:hypothetical protein